jgi:hypothetical protein
VRRPSPRAEPDACTAGQRPRAPRHGSVCGPRHTFIVPTGQERSLSSIRPCHVAHGFWYHTLPCTSTPAPRAQTGLKRSLAIDSWGSCTTTGHECKSGQVLLYKYAANVKSGKITKRSISPTDQNFPAPAALTEGLTLPHPHVIAASAPRFRRLGDPTHTQLLSQDPAA